MIVGILRKQALRVKSPRSLHLFCYLSGFLGAGCKSEKERIMGGACGLRVAIDKGSEINNLPE